MEPRITFMKPSSVSNKGVALVIVLSFLALVTVVVVAFFSNITLDVNAARQADSGARSKQLADTAVNIVMGQIKQATSRGGNLVWVSQPGMIRVTGSAGGNDGIAFCTPLAYYKLYSSKDMEVTLSEIAGFSAAQDVPSDWYSQTAQYTDLNAPAQDSTGTPRYPILDPSAFGVVAGSSVTNAPLDTKAGANLAPMPVRWMYILRDGTLTASGSGSTTALWPTTTSTAYKSPTRDNPIVGRIAFWTDDDTCKVNINTASEGTYWDVPRTTGTAERDFGLYQPAQHEWQRYPGHPATTCLSTVFPSLSAQEIYRITPRINGGGYNAGTSIPTARITADTDRLYASVDELMFDPLHTGTNAAGLTAAQIEQAKFFLTTHSRAPEVTLFNRPRIACWPIAKDLAANAVTPFDKLIALCSTIGGHPYYFQRKNSDSAAEDISIPRNNELYLYLINFTSRAVPGFRAQLLETFLTKYPSDRDQILTEIFDYIRSTNLQDDNLPAAGRFTRPADSTTGGLGWVVPSQRYTTMGFGRAFTLSELAIGFICNAAPNDPATSDDESAGSNTLANPNLAASGSLLALNQRMVQAVIVPDFFSVMHGWTSIAPSLRVEVSGLQNLKLNGQSFFASGTASINYTKDAGLCLKDGRGYGGAGGWRYFAAGINPGSDLPLVSQSVRVTVPSASGSSTMNFSGGNVTVALCSLSGTYQTLKLNLPPAANLPIPKIASQGTSAEVSGTATTKEQWWILNNMGSAAPWNAGRVFNAGASPGTPGSRGPGAFFREEYDVVRAIIPKHGDFRLIAAQSTITDTANNIFVKHPRYDSDDATACLLAHFKSDRDLRGRTGAVQDGGRRYFSSDALVPEESAGLLPYIYPGASAANRPEATGDFDTGMAGAMDGPFINKPDEGDIAGLELSPPQPAYFYSSESQTPPGATFFSPNRMMPSPGMFGSLPTGVKAKVPWKTLLFRPQGTDFSASGASGLLRHPSDSTTVPDHLLMDLFWMPVVEPYALSEPLSTAGKVNMNYQLMPFTYIERSTALRAVFKAEKLAAIPSNPNGINLYKSGTSTLDIRYEIDVNNAASATKKDSEIETLNQFYRKFTVANELFKSASEICDLHIVPTGQTVAGMPAFWNDHQLTGDNLRERIYTTLYPRLTTKSNTFTVHYRVQVLKQSTGGRSTAAQWATWNEAKDQVLSECRGSTAIERYIDPNDPSLPDFASSSAPNMDDYYKFRVVSDRKFTP